MAVRSPPGYLACTSAAAACDATECNTNTSASPPFLEGDYLARYPDVLSAVRAHVFESGRQHWLSHGIAEGRVGYGIGRYELLDPGASLVQSLLSPPAPRDLDGIALQALQSTLDCWGRGSWVAQPGSGDEVPVPVWQPTGPCSVPLPELNASSWCELHADTRLLLIGDSITTQTIDAMKLTVEQCDLAIGGVDYAIGCDDPPRYDAEDGYTEAGFAVAGCKVFSVCDGRAQVASLRNDFLDLTLTKRHFIPRAGRLPLGNLLECMQPTHIIINRGAHYGPDRAFVLALDSAIQVLRATAPAAQLLLRTTPHGHVHCEQHHAPWSALPPDYTQYVASLPNNWNHFPRQNELMRRVAAWHGVPVIDYAGPAALRPDQMRGPKDCLHYEPGPRSPSQAYARLNAGAIRLATKVSRAAAARF